MGLLLLFGNNGTVNSVSHSIDTIAQKTLIKSHNIDALQKQTLTKSYSIDSYVGAITVGTKSHVIDSISKKTLSKNTGVATATLKTFEKSYTLSTYIILKKVLSHGIDSNIFGLLGRQVQHGIDLVIGQFIKTQSIDASISKVATTVSNDLDSLSKKTSSKSYGIDVSIGTLEKYHSVDLILRGVATAYTSVDTSLSKTGLTVTQGIDVFKTTGALTKTHLLDITLKGTLAVNYILDAVLYRNTSTVASAVDARIASPQSFSFVTEEDEGQFSVFNLINQSTINSTTDITNALARQVIFPRARITHILNMNNYVNGVISAGDAEGDEASNVPETLIDGYDRASMKFAIVDTGCLTNDGFRLFPDFTNVEGDDYIDYPKAPWVSNVLCDSSGLFSPALQFTVSYSSEGVDCNAIQVVTDPYGPGSAGIITSMTIETSTNGSNWVVIASNISGYQSEKPHKPTIWFNGISWVTTRPQTLSGYTNIKYLRYTINRITVNQTIPLTNRPRPLLLYELSPLLYSENKIHNSDILDFDISETRDLGGQTLSPIAASTANVININSVDFGEELYNVMSKEYYKATPSFENSLVQIELGFKISNGNYEFLDYGTFVIDDAQISSDNKISISGRDFSKYLQDSKMGPFVYNSYRLHEVIRDVVERAGIEDYKISTSFLNREELATGITREFISVDELADILHDNVVWNQESTYWEFLQQIANSDLGAFYFDREGVFVYKNKEEFSTPKSGYNFELQEDTDIKSFTSQRQIAKNIFKLRYRVPHLSENPVGLWEAAEPLILDATSLAAPIDSATDSIMVGDISDWPTTGYFQIDNEVVKYNDRIDDAFLKCERGYLGTIPSPHYPDTREEDWTFRNGDWQMTGGQLVARNQPTGEWGTALIDDNVTGDRYNVRGKLTIKRPPYRAGIIIKAVNHNKFYLFSVKSVARVNENDGVTGDEAENLYQLYSYDGGNTTLLAESGDKSRVKKLIYTGIPTEFQVQVDKEQLSLFIRGTRVLTYEVEDEDLDIEYPARIGVAARGKGPTEFDYLRVMTLPEARVGEKLLTGFSFNFGKPIYEIRKIEEEYSSSPAVGIQYYLTNSNDAKVIYFKPGPFKSTVYVKNERDGFAIINATFSGEDEEFSEFFYITGRAIENTEEAEAMVKNDKSIVKYGKQELDLAVPWVQSETHAQLLLDYLEDVYSDAVDMLEINIHPNPLIRIGSVVKLTGNRYKLMFPANLSSNNNIFHVTGIRTNYTPEGINQSLSLRSAARTSLVPVVGNYSASMITPPSTFYISQDTDYVATMGFAGYTEQALGKSDAETPAAPDGLKIPVRIWRPSTISGGISANRPDVTEDNIPLPSNLSASGQFPTIIWAHEAYPFNADEVSNYEVIKKWLIKIVRAGYNIIFTEYRGSGGHGKTHFESMSYGYKEIDDVKAVRDWAVARPYVNSSKVILAGFGHGGNITLAATRVYPTSFQGYLSISGTPNVGASILRPTTNWPRYVVDRYIESLGRIEDEAGLWLTKSPLGDMNNITNNPVLLMNAQLDSFADIKDVYDFYKQSVTLNKRVTASVYKNRTQGWIFAGDGGNPNRAFITDPWLRIMQWIDTL